MIEFKVGDRVKIVADIDNNSDFYSIGASGIIIDEKENPSLAESDLFVEFDSGEYDASCDGSWYVNKADVELVNP